MFAAVENQVPGEFNDGWDVDHETSRWTRGAVPRLDIDANVDFGELRVINSNTASVDDRGLWWEGAGGFHEDAAPLREAQDQSVRHRMKIDLPFACVGDGDRRPRRGTRARRTAPRQDRGIRGRMGSGGLTGALGVIFLISGLVGRGADRRDRPHTYRRDEHGSGTATVRTRRARGAAPRHAARTRGRGAGGAREPGDRASTPCSCGSGSSSARS